MNYFNEHARDPISSLSHLIGAAISTLGMAILILKAALATPFNLTNLIGCLIFGISLVALYSTSGIYHFVKADIKILNRLQKLDHAMIYVLIAGTYTPILLTCMPPRHAFWLTLIVWLFAAVGIIAKIFWFDSPRWFSTLMYILMGWLIIVDIKNLLVPTWGIILLLAGGLAYTIGGVIYAIKRPNFSQAFGFHEFFHMFVLLGSVFHYLFVLIYVA